MGIAFSGQGKNDPFSRELNFILQSRGYPTQRDSESEFLTIAMN
jgi:hypothetical protein